jgi:hypothetical protein
MIVTAEREALIQSDLPSAGKPACRSTASLRAAFFELRREAL